MKNKKEVEKLLSEEMEKLLSDENKADETARKEMISKSLEKARDKGGKFAKANATPICAVPPKAKPDKEKLPEQETKITPMKKGAGFGFFKRMKMRANPATTYLVTMLYGNGTMKHFVIQTTKTFFMLNKKKYHLNKFEGWYDINFHQNRLMYYVDYTEPLGKKINIEGDETMLNVTPENVEDVIGMEYVKVLSQAKKLTKWIKMCVFLAAIGVAMHFMILIIFILQSGIFSGIMSGLG